MNDDLNKFETEGYLGPFKLFTEDQCNEILNEKFIPRAFYTWNKSIHEKSEHVVKTSANPLIKDKLNALLGGEILLWASQFIKQKPGQELEWHLDVEYGSWSGVTLWLGLKNLNNKTSVSLITHSHLLDTAPRELRNKNKLSHYNDTEIQKKKKKLDSRCELKKFNLNIGEFIIWSGRVWHTTSNQSDKSRESIIFQYSTPKNITKIPANFDYPNTLWKKTKPPCVLIFGHDDFKL